MFKDFGKYAKKVSEEIKDKARELTDKEGRPLISLDASRINKEDVARKIQEEEGVKEGLSTQGWEVGANYTPYSYIPKGRLCLVTPFLRQAQDRLLLLGIRYLSAHTDYSMVCA